MSTTLYHHIAPAAVGPNTGADPLCQHEFTDGGLCAYDSVPGATRCPAHRDDNQPDCLGGAR